MKILHLCLSCFYIDNYAYQENMLVAEHVKLGHDVRVIASTETFGSNGEVKYIDQGVYLGSDGAVVERLEYKFKFFHYFAKKFRDYRGLGERIADFNPDLIVFHGLCAYALYVVASYKDKNPTVQICADSHEDFNNSGRNLFSKWILHYLFYKTILSLSLPNIKKVYCISKEAENLVVDFYRIPVNKVQFLPLGGVLRGDSEYAETRANIRNRYGWGDDTRVFIQSGKFDAKKKIIESLLAFKLLTSSNIRLVLVGVLMEDIRKEADSIISTDDRIINLGWMKPNELEELLIASDIYVQPGSQSATMQMAVCCRLPVIISDVLSHRALYCENGWLIGGESNLVSAYANAEVADKKTIRQMSINSVAVARKYLDYSMQARQIISDVMGDDYEL